LIAALRFAIRNCCARLIPIRLRMAFRSVVGLMDRCCLNHSTDAFFSTPPLQLAPALYRVDISSLIRRSLKSPASSPPRSSRRSSRRSSPLISSSLRDRGAHFGLSGGGWVERRHTSPWWGEVALRCRSGAGASHQHHPRSTSCLLGLRRGQPVGAHLLLRSDGGTFEPISTATVSVSLLYEGEVLLSSEVEFGGFIPLASACATRACRTKQSRESVLTGYLDCRRPSAIRPRSCSLGFGPVGGLAMALMQQNRRLSSSGAASVQHNRSAQGDLHWLTRAFAQFAQFSRFSDVRFRLWGVGDTRKGVRSMETEREPAPH
jgi:hypothetical protein